MRLTSRSRQGLALVAGLAVSLPLMLGQGCPTVGGGGSAAPVVVVRSPSTDQTLAVGELATVVYDVTGSGTISVSAFYDHDGVADSGDEVAFMTGLATGQNKFTQLSTNSLAAGTYRLGIKASNSSGETTSYAVGRVILTAAPQITFSSPAGALRVGVGVAVPVEFTASVDVFIWRMYYDTDGILNGNETEIATNSSPSPTVSTSMNTTGMSPGTYYLGLTVTTPNGGTSTSYAPGTITLVSGAYIQLLSPSVGLVAQPGTLVQVRVAASDPSSPSTGIRIFYDGDNTLGNGNEVDIATIPLDATGATWDTKDVPPGTYWVGAELLNGLTPPMVSYSIGPVTVGQPGSGGGPGTGVSALKLATPQTAQMVFQGSNYRINWTTNLKPGKGTVTIFREPDLNNDGVADGAAWRVVIAAGVDVTQQFVDLQTAGIRGKFFIGATLTPIEGDPLTVYAPGTLTIRPKVFWVGDLLTKRDALGRAIPQTGAFQGAVFQGVNFQDNLGSTMLATDDYDGDGKTEILMGAQYAKPWFISSQGRGAGEAYMFYGPDKRFSGTIGANAAGDGMPGTLFTGIVPNPNPGTLDAPAARAGNSIPYTVDGRPAAAFDTEGLRNITLIPDQDGDGKQEIVFGFPWCNSFSLSYQSAVGTLPDPISCMGRLENNGHFLRGGAVMLSSQNSLLTSRTAYSRHLDRVLQLHQVGQVFAGMCLPAPDDWAVFSDNCGNLDFGGGNDTWLYPCEGWRQIAYNAPRLADSFRIPGVDWLLPDPPCSFMVDITQFDPPAGYTDPLNRNLRRYVIDNGNCAPILAPAGYMYTAETGFYFNGGRGCGRNLSEPMEPLGCRLLGQNATAIQNDQQISTANRFANSISVSGDFLLAGAPLRTTLSTEVPSMPEISRPESGQIYMIQLKRPGAPANAYPYALPSQNPAPYTPRPHNWVVQELGFNHCDNGTILNVPSWEISNPFHIVGAAANDRIGDVTGAHDINNDGVEDFVVGGAGTNGGRGAVYVIYRRQPEVEHDYLLERIQYGPTHLDRLNGMFIIGEAGENLGTSIAAGGPLDDNFNDDTVLSPVDNQLVDASDVLIGSPQASTAGGYMSGKVFILFGGKNLLNPAGGSTIADLVASGDGMLLTGAHAGDMAGSAVANAGDVNGDGIPDIMIAAPQASPRFDSDGDGVPDTIGIDLNGDGITDDLDGNGTPDDLTNAGLVYIVYGGKHLKGTISLSLIGTGQLPTPTEPGWGLPGFVIVGRKGGDFLGGGYTQPTDPLRPETGLLSHGLAPAGDLDRDGKADIMLSSVLADPDGKTNAGEVYVIYGLAP